MEESDEEAEAGRLTVESFDTDSKQSAPQGTVFAAADTDVSCGGGQTPGHTCDQTNCCSELCFQVSSFTDNSYCCA